MTQLLVAIDELYRQSQYLRDVRVAELGEAIAPLAQRKRNQLGLTEHLLGVLLIGFELHEEHVHLALLHLIYIAKVDEQLVSLVYGHVHVTKMLHESGQFVEDDVDVASGFLIELRFFRLHETLEFGEALLKSICCALSPLL